MVKDKAMDKKLSELKKYALRVPAKCPDEFRPKMHLSAKGEWVTQKEAGKLVRRIQSLENLCAEQAQQLEELENALIPLIPVAFHGDKSAFQDEGFRDAFKSMILKSYLKVQRDELNQSKDE